VWVIAWPTRPILLQTSPMNKLWVRLSLAFSSVIILAILLMALTGALFDSDGPPAVSQATEAARREYVRERLPGVVLGMGAVIGLVGIGAGIWISRNLTAPLRELESAAHDIGRRRLSRRVRIDGSSEMRAVAQAFNQMAAELEQAEQLRRNLMADVAHELRTPLSVIQGNLRAILDDVYPLEKGEVARLYDQTRHLSRLVNDLHDLAQAEAHELPLSRHRLDLVGLVEATTELFAPLAEAEEVALQVELPPSPLSLTADRARLTQALQNLLANALRHTPAGGTIAVRVRPTQEAGGSTVHLIVEDTGVGIEPDHLPHLFERFYRTDRARSRDTGGTGLGLAIVQAIAVAHGGQVLVQSKGEGYGSRFVIALPVAHS